MSSILPTLRLRDLVVVVVRLEADRVLVASGRGSWWVPRAWILCTDVLICTRPFPLDNGARCT